MRRGPGATTTAHVFKNRTILGKRKGGLPHAMRPKPGAPGLFDFVETRGFLSSRAASKSHKKKKKSDHTA
mgnify:CR=1 FL=1